MTNYLTHPVYLQKKVPMQAYPRPTPKGQQGTTLSPSSTFTTMKATKLWALKAKDSCSKQQNGVGISFALEHSGTPQPISTYLVLLTPKLVLPACALANYGPSLCG